MANKCTKQDNKAWLSEVHTVQAFARLMIFHARMQKFDDEWIEFLNISASLRWTMVCEYKQIMYDPRTMKWMFQWIK